VGTRYTLNFKAFEGTWQFAILTRHSLVSAVGQDSRSREKIAAAFNNKTVSDVNDKIGTSHCRVRGNTLLKSDGTEIVSYFGIPLKIFVSGKVEVPQKSCFESLHGLTETEEDRSVCIIRL
jgi:hypothetical protein